VEGDFNFLQKDFVLSKVWILPPPIHPMAEVKDKIFCEDAQFLHLRCINTVENIQVEKGEQTNDLDDIQTTINKLG